MKKLNACIFMILYFTHLQEFYLENFLTHLKNDYGKTLKCLYFINLIKLYNLKTKDDNKYSINIKYQRMQISKDQNYILFINLVIINTTCKCYKLNLNTMYFTSKKINESCFLQLKCDQIYKFVKIFSKNEKQFKIECVIYDNIDFFCYIFKDKNKNCLTYNNFFVTLILKSKINNAKNFNLQKTEKNYKHIFITKITLTFIVMCIVIISIVVNLKILKIIKFL